MNIFGWLAGGGLSTIDKILGRFLKDKDALEANIHAEQMTAMQASAAEFQYRGERYWFDSLVDGLNRLPRPLLALGVIGLFVYAPIDPLNFTIYMQAYSLVPEWLTYVFMQIIFLYMGGRMLEKWNGKMRGPTAEQFKEFTKNVEELKKLAPPGPPSLVKDAPVMDQEEFEREMADTSKPLSNASIIEWNRRRQANQR